MTTTGWNVQVDTVFITSFCSSNYEEVYVNRGYKKNCTLSNNTDIVDINLVDVTGCDAFGAYKNKHGEVLVYTAQTATAQCIYDNFQWIYY